MNKNRITAIIVGILILVAYSMLASVATDIKWIVALFDIVSGFAVIGIAKLMFPLFKTLYRQLSYGYLVMKILEGALMIAAGTFFLSNSFQDWRLRIYDSIIFSEIFRPFKYSLAFSPDFPDTKSQL